jgi:AcrR family transcriptional regulator
METANEIKTVALKHMADKGTAAISLRAIARDMGMTAGAIYSYYDNRDILISALITDVYNTLTDVLTTTSNQLPPGNTAARIRAHGLAYREWAINHPEEFRLLYGDPEPDYQPPAGGAALEAERKLCDALLELVAAAWPQASALVDLKGYKWSDFESGISSHAKEIGLPPAAVALSFRVWGRMHGLVALEIYGHLSPQVTDAGKLYASEMQDLTRSLGLTK